MCVLSKEWKLLKLKLKTLEIKKFTIRKKLCNQHLRNLTEVGKPTENI